MIKYQELISKIQILKATKSYSEFSPSELELITDALETIQLLEIIFKVRDQWIIKNSELLTKK